MTHAQAAFSLFGVSKSAVTTGLTIPSPSCFHSLLLLPLSDRKLADGLGFPLETIARSA